MFNFGEFVKIGFLKSVGKMSDYQIILNAAGWHDKGVLSLEDLSEIQIAIDEKNKALTSDGLDESTEEYVQILNEKQEQSEE